MIFLQFVSSHFSDDSEAREKESNMKINLWWMKIKTSVLQMKIQSEQVFSVGSASELFAWSQGSTSWTKHLFHLDCHRRAHFFLLFHCCSFAALQPVNSLKWWFTWIDLPLFSYEFVGSRWAVLSELYWYLWRRRTWVGLNCLSQLELDWGGKRRANLELGLARRPLSAFALSLQAAWQNVHGGASPLLQLWVLHQDRALQPIFWHRRHQPPQPKRLLRRQRWLRHYHEWPPQWPRLATDVQWHRNWWWVLP